MGHQGIIYHLGWVAPFDTSVQAFCILAEDGHIHYRFLDFSGSAPPDEIKRIPRVRFTGTKADVKAKMLAQTYDRAGIDEFFITEMRRQFWVAASLGFEVMAPKRPVLCLSRRSTVL